MERGYQFDERGYQLLRRVVFGFILLALLNRYFANVLLHQLESPVLQFTWVDLTYWVAHLLDIPESITGSKTAGLIFDISLFLTAAGSFYWVKNRYLPIAFTVLFLIYFITYNSYGGHHTHCMIGLLLVGIPFWFKRLPTFSLLWEGLRYYTLFIYFSAFLWKLVRGYIFYPQQGVTVFLDETATYIYQNPDSSFTGLFTYMIENPSVSFAFLLAGTIAEALFIIGYFTRKLDWLWLILAVTFHTLSYFFLHVFFFELLVLTLTFLPYERIFRSKNNQHALDQANTG